MLCDDVIKLLEICKEEYPDIPPEFIPIAKKYGVDVANYLIRSLYDVIDIDTAIRKEYEREGPLRNYVNKLAEFMNVDPEAMLNSDVVKNYYLKLRGLG